MRGLIVFYKHCHFKNLPNIFKIARFDCTCLLSPCTAVFFPKEVVLRIRKPIRKYRKIIMVIGIKKKNRNEVSNRNRGVGVIVQNADSGIVCKKENCIEFHEFSARLSKESNENRNCKTFSAQANCMNAWSIKWDYKWKNFYLVI